MTQAEQQQDASPTKTKRTPAEWVTFGIASLILATIATLVVYLWVTKQDTPPVLSVTQNEKIREVDGQFYVPFELTNTGGETAESIQVIAELRIAGKVEETGEQQIDFLSSREVEEGAFVFRQDPAQGELTLRVASYKLP
jgi:uncharacterized protein (TIGR02588 family)